MKRNSDSFTLARLPLPDGTYRMYKIKEPLPAPERFNLIMAAWQFDCDVIKFANTGLRYQEKVS